MKLQKIITAKNLVKKYGHQPAVLHDVSFFIKKGECLGLVGQSGCGKSTLAKCLLLLEKLDEGELWFEEHPLHAMNKNRREIIQKKVQAVFQNPAASLNPKLKIMDSLLEPLDYQRDIQPSFLEGFRYDREKAGEFLLNMVQLSSKYLHAYPHELSGGQKQRVVIARAISIEPALIILDEPTGSLDVSIQAKILNLLKDLQDELEISYLFISHDLAAVNFMSDRIMVMKDGIIVDECRKQGLFSKERHPYTKELLAVFES